MTQTALFEKNQVLANPAHTVDVFRLVHISATVVAIRDHTVNFLTDLYGHGKAFLAWGASGARLNQAGLSNQCSGDNADLIFPKAANVGVAAGIKAVVNSALKKRHPQ